MVAEPKLSSIIECISDEIKEKDLHNNDIFYVLMGFLIFIISIFILEKFNQSLYFLNDDNLHEFLFPIIYGCKSLVNNCILAEINPFQFAGIPLAGISTYALSYPITYFCYFIAKDFLHNEFWTIDVFCIFHLALAYFLSYYAARSCKVKNYISVIFALCYSLSGFSLIIGRSWFNITPCIAYSPIIILSVNYLIKNKPDLKWIIFTGLPLGLLGIAGHIQMWVYTMMFFVLTFLLMFVLKKLTLSKLISIFYPVSLCIFICMPQFYVTMDLVRYADRIASNGWDLVIKNLSTFFIPFYSLTPMQDILSAEKVICFSGGILTIAAFLSIIAVIIRKHKIPVKFIKNNPWLIIGLIAFFLALSDNIGLWPLLHLLPLFNKFRQALRAIVFVNLFLNLGGAIVLSKLTITDNKKFKYTLIFLMSLVLLRHLLLTQQSFFIYQVKTLPDINNIIAKLPDIKEHRIYSISPFRSKYNLYPMAFNLNFATGYELYSTNGYDDALSSVLRQNVLMNPPNFLFPKIFGVKYVIYQQPYNKTNYFDAEYASETNSNIEKYLNKSFKKIYSEDLINIYETKNYLPLAFAINTKQILPIKFNSQGAVVNIQKVSPPQRIVINMINYPRYKAYLIDGSNNKISLPIENNHYNQMIISIPENNKSKKLIIKYESPWNIGFTISIIILIISSWLYIFQNRKKLYS